MRNAMNEDGSGGLVEMEVTVSDLRLHQHLHLSPLSTRRPRSFIHAI